MQQVTCRYCGDRFRVGPADSPLTFREDSAETARKRQFVVVGGGILLHRCELGPEAETLETPLHP
jgi:hypothetical protein